MRIKAILSHLALGMVVSIIVAGCAGLQAQSTSKIIMPLTDKKTAFDMTLSAATNAGMTVVSSDYEGGLIVAVSPGNPFLTFRNPTINIVLQSSSDGATTISLSGITHGQLFDYGIAGDALEKLCSGIKAQAPMAVCT